MHIGCYLPLEYRELLRRFCEESHLTLSGAICYLLDLHYPDRPDPDEEDWRAGALGTARSFPDNKGNDR